MSKFGIINVFYGKGKRKMKRLKTFLIYALIIVGFYFFSEFLITVGLSASYEDIIRKDNVSQVEIYEAQATLVNGKVKGVIKDSRGNESLTGKYVEIDFYSKRDNVVARKYIPIETTDVNNTQEFSTYFEAGDVTSYSIAIVDEKEQGELNTELEDWERIAIYIGLFLGIINIPNLLAL